ncbi:hypothetical protein QE361_002677 [Sphingomonas sp. SORGH_AS802]|nr:hypothetical protein [Sphingomonas sp. SORGH_AS_0438]MDR6135682.1 hypothetical protein [Sphingomonas sp. SORGH_AS_0802]
MLSMLLLLASQAGGTMDSKHDVPFPAVPPDISAVGIYTPNADLLRRCTSKQAYQVLSCNYYIEGVEQAAGMVTARFPKGFVALDPSVDPTKAIVEKRQLVVDYINALPNTEMSSPAAYSVYAALVAKFPFKGFNMQSLPPGAAEDHEEGSARLPPQAARDLGKDRRQR